MADDEPQAEAPGTGRNFLLGATSIIGFNLARLYPDAITPVCTSRSRHSAVLDWPRLRLECEKEVATFLHRWQPQVIIYCDAVCDVEKCEKSPEWAHQINVGNLEVLLSLLPAQVRLVYVSSDHVFGGDGVYHEQSDVCPISAYGRTRVLAEQAAASRPGTLIIRPGLPIGPSMDGRTGHQDWLRYRTENLMPVTIVHDEARSAVCMEAMAERILCLAESGVTGMRHICADRAVYRPELALHLIEQMRLPKSFVVRSRSEQRTPHLGHVELGTLYSDALAALLPSVCYSDQSVNAEVSS